MWFTTGAKWELSFSFPHVYPCCHQRLCLDSCFSSLYIISSWTWSLFILLWPKHRTQSVWVRKFYVTIHKSPPKKYLMKKAIYWLKKVNSSDVVESRTQVIEFTFLCFKFLKSFGFIFKSPFLLATKLLPANLKSLRGEQKRSWQFSRPLKQKF